MSFFESAIEGLGVLFEKSKELPVEKIAIIAVTALAFGSMAKDLAQGNIDAAAEKAKNLLSN